MLIIKGIITILFQAIFFGIILLVPAGLLPGGTWYWERAIYFLVGYLILVEILVVWLAIKGPAGLEARYKIKAKKKKQPTVDKILLPLLSISFLVGLVIIPVDVFYIQFLPKPNLIWSIIGAVLIVLGLLGNVGSIYSNAFITPTVQDQTDDGQKVADTGVYSIVRHPMYASLILLFGGMALWLESWLGVIALLPMILIMIIRIGIEEKTLKTVLPGYPEYTKKVKYRLLPFVW
ncbi:methyltransferase family protein [Patescibacteria group bacterium]